MSDEPLERGEDIKVIEEGGWLIYWDGTPHGWIRCRSPADLENWP